MEVSDKKNTDKTVKEEINDLYNVASPQLLCVSIAMESASPAYPFKPYIDCACARKVSPLLQVTREQKNLDHGVISSGEVFAAFFPMLESLLEKDESESLIASSQALPALKVAGDDEHSSSIEFN